MKDIIWKKLSTGEKIIYVLGWFSVFNLVFWAVFLIVYTTSNRKGKYQSFFNPHTLKVPYVFGWINLMAIILTVILMVSFMTMFSIMLA